MLRMMRPLCYKEREREREAAKMILEAYSALLLLAFLSTESKFVQNSIAAYLPLGKLAELVPILERFMAFHVSKDMMTPEKHKTVCYNWIKPTTGSDSTRQLPRIL
ncbi:hypothetical protein MLD38_010032 [Melastoma candidum]|uniref:Uncharacterized protein n=1 Tax=Melastoma candidum TaxID=119954 RepID=A0ACB9R0C4_9MYRT|nr:hypothetical protein MLD38_010032 [Melastoma candidum]